MAAAEVRTQKFSALAQRGPPGAVVSDARFDIPGPGQDLEGTDFPHQAGMGTLDNARDAELPAQVEEARGDFTKPIRNIDDALV